MGTPVIPVSGRFAAVLAGAMALASCGGEVVAVLGFVGSAGGSWFQDDQPAVDGLQRRSTCGALADEDCFINIQPVGGQSLFSGDFALTFTSNLPGCAASGNGSASGARLTLNNCFRGQYVNINQALSDDGSVRMFFNFEPDLAQGVWVEIQDGRRRFAFPDPKVNSATTGCELTSPASTPVDIVLSPARILDAGGPFETTIASFAVQGGGAAWQGRFVGVSGMRLVRGGEVLELQRRTGTPSC